MGLFDDVLEPAPKKKGGLFDDVLAPAPAAGLSRDSEDEVADLIGVPRRERGGNTYVEAALKNIPRLGELAAQALRSVTLIPEAALNTAERFGVPADNLGLSIQRDVIDAIGTPADEMNRLMRGLDSVGYGQGKAQIKDAKEALNPWANDNRAKAAEAFGAGENYQELTLGARARTLGDFIAHGTLNSVADMTGAVLAPAPYVAAYTDQTARERAANDGRPLGFSDITIGAGNALVQTVAEKFATERLFPGGVKPVMDGAAAALGRVARETGIQGGTEYAQEAVDYLSTQLGTKKGATLAGTNDAGLSGLLIGAPLGTVAQGAKEVLGGKSPVSAIDTLPDNAIDPAVLAAQAAAPPASKEELLGAQARALGDAALGSAVPSPVDVVGGTPATPADITSDAAIVEAFRSNQAAGAVPAGTAEPALSDALDPDVLAEVMAALDLPPAAPAPAEPSDVGAGVAATSEIARLGDVLGLQPEPADGRDNPLAGGDLRGGPEAGPDRGAVTLGDLAGEIAASGDPAGLGRAAVQGDAAGAQAQGVTPEKWTPRGGRETRVNISDSVVEGSSGAISFEVRRDAEDRTPLQLWVTRDGKLTERGKAFTAEGEQVHLWNDGTPEQKSQVVDLLRERGNHPIGSQERKEIDGQIADVVTGKGSSRDNPLPNEREGDAPVGAWVAGPPIPGATPDQTVRQIMEVPIEQIDATEFDSAGNIAPEKRADAERYTEAMRAGDQFPNGRASELPNGKIKLQDGHRRYAAAKASGAKTMRLAVSPMPAGAQAPAVAPDGFPAPPPARFSAADMRSLVGWSQRGGEMVRAPVDPEQLNEEQRNGLVPSPLGEVIGRTRWTGYPGPDGQESTFWKNRPVPYTPAQATAVFDKFEAGEALTKREQRFIDYAQETAAGYDDALNLQADEARGYEQIAAQQDMAELRAQLESDIADADAAEAMSLADLYRELAQSGVDLGTVTPSDTEADGEYAARLWQRLNETRNGTDQPAKAGDSAQGQGGRGGREAGAGVEPSFALDAPARTAAAAAAAEGQADGDVPRDAGVRDAYDGRQADRVSAAPAEAAPPVTEEAPAPRVTGTKNAVTDAERQAAGRDPILREAVQSNEETVVRAMREIREDPTAGEEAVARLSRDGVESISVADEAILLVHKTDLLNKREAAAKKLADTGASEATKDAARQAWAEAEAKIAQLDLAASNAGREWGRFGQFRQRMMREDFTLAAMERKERARLERPLTQEESATIKAMADTIAVLQGKVDALQERMNNAASESAYEALARSVARPPRKRPTLEALRTAANDARARLSATQGVPSRRGQSGAILSPAVFYDYAVIGAFHIADGAAKFSDWVSAMSADLGDAFDRIKADHPNIFKAAKQQIENVVPEGPTPATVVETIDQENPTPHDVKRVVEALIRVGVRGESEVMAAAHKVMAEVVDGITEREVRRLFADYGNASFPSQEEAKVELRQLRSLVQMQESIDRISEGLAPLRSGPQRDAMTQQVREKRARLNELLKTLAKDAKSPTQMRSYNDMRVRNLTNQIEDLEKQIRTGERPAAKVKATPTAEIQALMDRRDALVRERDSVDVGAKQNEAEKRALRKRIEAVEARLRGESPAPKEPLQRVDDREATDLRNRLDALRERRDQVGREAAAREGLGEQIAELMRRLAGKEKPAAPAKAPSSAVVAELRRIRDELATELRELERAPVDTEARYQAMRGKQIERRIAELQARITAGDFAARPRVPRALSEANQRAMFELDKAKEAFLRHQFEDSLRKRTPLGKAFGLVGDTFNLARAMMTSFDLSAILRQGGFISYGHPLRAVSSIGPSLKAFVSEANEHALNTEITSRKNAPLYKKYGLQLTGIGAGPLTQIEEAYASRWLSKLPWWTGGGLVRGSGRSYTAFLNKLRADSFDAMAATLGRTQALTEAEGKAIASYINVATGRGKVGVKEQSAQALNTVFFAPRLVASRFQLLAGQPLYGGTARTRKLIVQEYARFAVGVSVVLALTAFAMGEDDDDSDKPLIGLDPRSADFLKVRTGNTYIDPMAGLAQVSTFIARMATGETLTGKGVVKPLRTGYTLTDLRRALGSDIPAHEMAKDGRLPFGSGNAAGVLGRFLRTKLAPVPGAIVNVLSGSNAIGDPVTPAKAATEMVTPMSFQNIADVMEEHGVPKWAAITTLGLLGMGVQHRLQSNAQAFADFTDGLDEVRADVKERLKAVPVEQWPATMEALRKEYGPAMEGLELQVYKTDGKYGEEGEPRRDADGNPVLKSNRIADNYREDSGAMDDEQVHHAIPDNLARHHPLMARARSLGYDLDNAGNLLNMPKKSDGDRIAHRTSHPDYDAEVFALLEAAEKRIKKAHGSLKEAPKPAVLDEVRKIEDAMRERIQRKDVPTKDGRLALNDEDARGAA